MRQLDSKRQFIHSEMNATNSRGEEKKRKTFQHFFVKWLLDILCMEMLFIYMANLIFFHWIYKLLQLRSLDTLHVVVVAVVFRGAIISYYRQVLCKCCCFGFIKILSMMTIFLIKFQRDIFWGKKTSTLSTWNWFLFYPFNIVFNKSFFSLFIKWLIMWNVLQKYWFF